VRNEQEIIENILNSIPVPEDAVVLVHSSLRKLSHQGYKAEAIIEALLKHINKGTLLMPTMSWRTVTPENPIWDENNTPSHTGVMTEIFRTKYATRRSIHPTHSVAGYGSHIDALLYGHHLGTTPVPLTSPYGVMKNYNSFILLIGVGLEMCTAIHHPEEIIAPEIYLKPEKDSENYLLKLKNGNQIDYKLRRHKPIKRNFSKFEAMLCNKSMKKGRIENVPWLLFKMSDLMEIVFAELLKNNKATI